MSPTTALVPLDGESLPTHAESSSLPALLAQPHARPDQMRGVDARPLRVRGFGRYVRSRVLRPARRRRARRGCDATRVIAKERGRRRRADGVERPARGVRQRRIGGVVDGTGDVGGDDRRRDSQLSFHGASPVVKLMFLPRDDSRDVPCVLVAVQENGAVAAWCRASRDDDDDVGWTEMAEPSVPGGPPEIAPSLRGYRKGAHGAVIDAALAVTEAADDGGGGGLWGGCVVRVVTLVESVPRSDPSSASASTFGPVVARLAHRAGGSHAVVGISRRDGSIAVFLRQGTRRRRRRRRRMKKTGPRRRRLPRSIPARSPCSALAGAICGWCARAAAEEEAAGGGGGKGGGEGGGGTHGHEGEGGGGAVGIRRENGCEAYRWNANLGVATARVNVAVAAAAAAAVAARIDGDRDWDEDNRKKPRTARSASRPWR